MRREFYCENAVYYETIYLEKEVWLGKVSSIMRRNFSGVSEQTEPKNTYLKDSQKHWKTLAPVW